MLKTKRTQLTEAQSERPKLVRELTCAADSSSKLQTGKDHASGNPPSITAAESRVLALLAHARTNKEIALDLGISPATVKRHMEKILTKLGLRNRVEAAIYGLLVNGCPEESNAGCVFRKLRAAGGDTASSRAD